MSPDPPGALIEYASQWNAPLVVVGSRQRGKIARNVLGSVSASLIQGSSAPVLLVPSCVQWPTSSTSPFAARERHCIP
jgi:nucleotide-binding universal stress UspA family protein